MQQLPAITLLITIIVLVAVICKFGASALSAKIILGYSVFVLLIHAALYYFEPELPARTSVTWNGRLEYLFRSHVTHRIDMFFRQMRIVCSALSLLASVSVAFIGMGLFRLVQSARNRKTS